MKIAGAKKAHYESGPNMTPLVDVVMVILIFLMLAGSLSGAEHFLVTNLPVSKEGTGGTPPSGIPDTQTLKINLNSYNGGAAGTGASDGFQATVNGSRAYVDYDSLAAALIQKHDEYVQNKLLDKVQVVIAPGERVKWKNLILVFEAATKAQFPKIGFATTHAEGH